MKASASEGCAIRSNSGVHQIGYPRSVASEFYKRHSLDGPGELASATLVDAQEWWEV